MPGDVSIIVPVWNGRALVERLMGSIRAQTCPVAKVLVVDNGSEDGAPEAAEALGAQVIRMGRNAGFSRAVNRGIAECGTAWTAVVNSDVELAPAWLEMLIAAGNDPEVWFATGKILNAADHGLIDGTYDALSRGGCAWRVGNGRADGAEFSKAASIQFASGTATIFRTQLFQRVGLFDETFESYLEDVEFGLRCACFGYAGRYVPEAVAYHVGSATLGQWHPETVCRIARNQVFLVAKYYPARFLLVLWWPVLVGQALWGFTAMRHGAMGAFLRGKLQGLRGFSAYRRVLRPGKVNAQKLFRIVAQSEQEIARVQRAAGSDWYWRVYFALTPLGRTEA